MDFFTVVALHPYLLLFLFGHWAFYAVLGNPDAVTKISPEEPNPTARSLAFYRSPLALASPVIIWSGVAICAAIVGEFQLLQRWGSTVVVLIALFSSFAAGFLRLKAEEHLMRRFLKRLPGPFPSRH